MYSAEHILNATVRYFEDILSKIGNLPDAKGYKRYHIMNKEKKDTLICKSRYAELVEIRYMMFYYTKMNTKVTNNSISKVACRDHSTGLHGIKTIAERLQVDKLLDDYTFTKKYKAYEFFMNQILKNESK